MIALLAAAAIAADCPTPVGPERWEQELAAAERGYGGLDRAAFDDHLDAAMLDLPCLGVVVPRTHAARYHALMGLRLYIAGQSTAATASFASARAADPAFVLPETLVPAGHDVRSLFDRALPGEEQPLAAPDDVTVWIDGSRAERRPTARPVIAQIVGETGEVRTSGYVSPGEPLPAYPVAEGGGSQQVSVTPVPVVPAPGPAPMPPPVVKGGRQPQWGFLAGAGVAGGVSAILYGLAADGAAKFAAPLEPDVGRDELLGLRNRTNGLVIGSVAAGGVAAASATLFVVAL